MPHSELGPIQLRVRQYMGWFCWANTAMPNVGMKLWHFHWRSSAWSLFSSGMANVLAKGSSHIALPGAECLIPCFVPILARSMSPLWFTFINNKLQLKAMSPSLDWEPYRKASLFLHLWQSVKAKAMFINWVNQLINHLWLVHSAYYLMWNAVEFRKRGNNSISRYCNPARETNSRWQTKWQC